MIPYLWEGLMCTIMIPYLWEGLMCTIILVGGVDVHHHSCSLAHGQRMPFDDGLAATAQWYRTHAAYWPDVDVALLPHPREARHQALTHSKWALLRRR